MEVNNFDLIKSFLEFENDDTFYFLQLIRRRKDNPDIPNEKSNNYRSIKTYFITSKEMLDSVKEEVITLCNIFNARAYIGLNKRSFERVAFEHLSELSKLIYNKQYHKVRKSYNSCAGYYSTGDKIWIVDIDDNSIILEVSKAIVKCDSGYQNIIIGTIPTLNGVHLLTRPFNLKQFEPFMVENNIDVHKNNPTLLYFNKK